jgi:hypothetical protein
MKKSVLMTVLAGLILLGTTLPVLARGGYGWGSDRRCGQYCGNGGGNGYCGMQYCGNGGRGGRSSDSYPQRIYDPKTVETIQGVIEKVETVERGRLSGGVHLTVKTDKETIPVMVGPDRFLEDNKLDLKTGDKIEVHGSRVEVKSKTVIIADNITDNGTSLKLRNADGKPLWSRRGSRS